MLSKEKMDRINYLANKSKNGELSEEEKQEQKDLREEYIKVFRKGMKSRLENITIVEE